MSFDVQTNVSAIYLPTFVQPFLAKKLAYKLVTED